MAEIRLVCPGCAAEYRVLETAIPAEGREVECSACGNVWHAGGPLQGQAAGDLPRSPVPRDEPPRLSRRLPDSVLDILRDEVEHERRARAAEAKAEKPALPAPPAVRTRPAADPDWPATTVTTAITPHVDPEPAAPPPLAPQAADKPALWPDPAPQPTSLPQPEASRPEPAGAAARPAPVTAPARGGYAAGFGLAVALAAACLALYVLAPTVAGQGAAGKTLMQIRGQVDEARLWLQDRATGLAR